MSSFHWPSSPFGRVLVAAALSCGVRICAASAEDVVATPPNVLLISIDTLRADHLGCYGYERPTSPHLDAFAAESFRYAHAFAPAPWTLPSHACMLTGVHPLSLAIHHERSAIPEDAPAVAEMLRGAGYQTAGFVDSMLGGFIGSDRGFARGFDTFSHAPHQPDLTYHYDFAATVDAAVRWLADRQSGKPSFLFLHTKSVHSVSGATRGEQRGFPYEKPSPYLERFHDPGLLGLTREPPYSEHLRQTNHQLASGGMSALEYPEDRKRSLIAQYDGGILYTDEHFGRLIAYLKESGLYDTTLIIVTADHGEAFLEHRFFLHNEVYDQLLHVPLLVKPPKVGESHVLESHVSLEDIAPTILQAAGLSPAAVMTGRPLPLADSDEKLRTLLAYYRFGEYFFKDEIALRQGPWKLVLHGYVNEGWGEELYNLDDDPGEQQPCINPEKSAEMRKILDAVIASADGAGAADIELDEETTEHLRSLGYLN